ncbi:MAG: hypothetical protein KF729_09155 [Sandaracinaceae bacterium]|nr:hypothetical protein [Sandaracinaceae bacterium]
MTGERTRALERAADDDTVRSLAGIILRATEADELDQLLASIRDDADRRFLSELATLASGEQELGPTSAELVLEEALEEHLPLADVHEAALLQGIARARTEGARRVWERALALLARER